MNLRRTSGIAANDRSATAAAMAAPSVLEASLRLSMEAAMRRALWIVLGAALAASGAVLLLVSNKHDAANAIGIALGTGGLCALVAIRSLSKLMARLCSRPIEMILSQPELVGDAGAEDIDWGRSRALSEAELEAHLESLSRILRAAARRSRETMAELESAREQANRQNVAKSQFLASMSHELRTPLNAILGYAMLLHEDAVDAGNPSAADDLDRIQIAGRNLLAIINDILDLAKIESGKAVVERGVVNVRDLVENLARSCPPQSRNGNDFRIEVSADVGILIGDGGKVRQCLFNLLQNAFKFTQGSSVTLSVEPALQSAIAGIAFSVRDTGIGIDPDHQETLFDAFSQVDDGSSSRLGGTGLGLAITRRLARLMSGDCTFVSEKGAGSTFTLWIPLSPHRQERRAVPRTNNIPFRAKAGNPIALVIDDDEAALDLMQRWLERNGYDILAAADAETGLMMAREHRPDLILLDALLPGRSGYDILPELSADPNLKRTPVILVTIDDDRARGLASGASDYLRKPLTERRLLSAIDPYRERSSGDVLVIDDDDDAAELIKRSIEQIGFSSRRASDGAQGITMASEARPAAIVLDLLMPGLNGFEVIDRLSANKDLANIPLIVVSGCEISLPEHRRLEAAGYRFFTKGAATPREIAQSLREMVA
jgi:signal transduction histidine kinase/CheY-like chemotaxis protein